MYDPIDLPDETLELQRLVRRICDDHQMPLERRILDGGVALPGALGGHERAGDAIELQRSGVGRRTGRHGQ